MLRVNLKKIKSALRYSLCFGAGLVVTGLVMLGTALRAEQPSTGATLLIGNNTYHLEVATTTQAQEKGLGNRVVMDADRGMLFTYAAVDQRCFWMKDMRFPLDIIWADSAKRITKVEQRLNPDTYPRAYCADAQYVIELNSGEAAKNHMRPGQTLHF